jgi:hypothetical protein
MQNHELRNYQRDYIIHITLIIGIIHIKTLGFAWNLFAHSDSR